MPLPPQARGVTLLVILLGTVVVTFLAVIIPCKGSRPDANHPRHSRPQMSVIGAVVLLIVFCCCYGVYVNYDLHCLANDDSDDSGFCSII